MTETFMYILSILLKVGIVPVALLIYKKKLTFLQGLFTATFLFIASFGCEVFYLNHTLGYSYIDGTVNTYFDEMKSAFGMDNGFSAEQAAAFGKAIDYVRNVYFALLPSLMVCIQLVGAYFWLMLSKGILALCKKDVSGFMRFCDFKMSRTGILAALLSFLFSHMLSGPRVSLAFLNIAAIMCFVTLVCGLSFVDFKLRSRISYSFLRFMLYLVVSGFVFGLGMWVLIIIGAVDAFLNLRVPRRKPDDFDE